MRRSISGLGPLGSKKRRRKRKRERIKRREKRIIRRERRRRAWVCTCMGVSCANLGFKC